MTTTTLCTSSASVCQQRRQTPSARSPSTYQAQAPRADQPSAAPLSASPARTPPATLTHRPRCTVTLLHIPAAPAHASLRVTNALSAQTHYHDDATAVVLHFNHCSKYGLFRTVPPAA